MPNEREGEPNPNSFRETFLDKFKIDDSLSLINRETEIFKGFKWIEPLISKESFEKNSSLILKNKQIRKEIVPLDSSLEALRAQVQARSIPDPFRKVVDDLLLREIGRSIECGCAQCGADAASIINWYLN